MRRLAREFTKGIIERNPVFALLLGLCPVLAVTTSLDNALGMGLSSTFVLVCANVLVSIIRGAVPRKVRIPCFIVVIASFVTLVELFLQAFSPDLFDSLGIFVPLIVVNCVILGRVEAFGSRNPVHLAFFDGLGMGIGFTLSLALIGFVREVAGAGSVWGYSLIEGYEPALILALPPGAFLTIGLLLGLFRLRGRKTRGRAL